MAQFTKVRRASAYGYDVGVKLEVAPGKRYVMAGVERVVSVRATWMEKPGAPFGLVTATGCPPGVTAAAEALAESYGLTAGCLTVTPGSARLQPFEEQDAEAATVEAVVHVLRDLTGEDTGSAAQDATAILGRPTGQMYPGVALVDEQGRLVETVDVPRMYLVQLPDRDMRWSPASSLVDVGGVGSVADLAEMGREALLEQEQVPVFHTVHEVRDDLPATAGYLPMPSGVAIPFEYGAHGFDQACQFREALQEVLPGQASGVTLVRGDHR